jgi:hypothetical protein
MACCRPVLSGEQRALYDKLWADFEGTNIPLPDSTEERLHSNELRKRRHLLPPEEEDGDPGDQYIIAYWRSTTDEV